ncbi:hypothetical protein LCGC14_2980790 [marine sediment metagenome]|uniref:Uncharacterized protein n=1 Tax=marine sediment metagenome TaxID=412755 RepID=A0A0F8XU62_9ZZZZ
MTGYCVKCRKRRHMKDTLRLVMAALAALSLFAAPASAFSFGKKSTQAVETVEIITVPEQLITDLQEDFDLPESSAAAIVDGAAATGTLSTTEMTTDLTISVADQYKGRIIIFASDTSTAALQGQATDITAASTTNGKLTFTALTTAPSNGDTFSIV